jgi:hypothetical protein
VGSTTGRLLDARADRLLLLLLKAQAEEPARSVSILAAGVNVDCCCCSPLPLLCVWGGGQRGLACTMPPPSRPVRVTRQPSLREAPALQGCCPAAAQHLSQLMDGSGYTH